MGLLVAYVDEEGLYVRRSAQSRPSNLTLVYNLLFPSCTLALGVLTLSRETVDFL